MKLADFNLADYPRGAKRRTMQAVTPEIDIPILVARGQREGRTLVVSANVHGDEYEGVRAIFEVFDTLEPSEMRGDLIAVPVVNPPAFWSSTRTSPIDGQNLARLFPGDPAGSISQLLAWQFAHSVIARADFYLDLHSGGVAFCMPSMAGYSLNDPRSRAAAEVFGAGVIWGHASISAGRTISFAHDRGIPWIYTEARGAGRIARDDLEMMKRGILNLLRHLEILSSPIEQIPIVRRLQGDGNTDCGTSAGHDGFLFSDVEILESVQRGQSLGRLVNLQGECIEHYRAAHDGVVGLVRELPVVRKGDIVFLLAEEQP